MSNITRWELFALLFLPTLELHMDTRTHRRMDGQTDTALSANVGTPYGHMDTRTHRQMDGWMDERTDEHHCNPLDIVKVLVLLG
jgi:hypothetical protein